MVIPDNPGASEDREGNSFICGTRQTLQQAAVSVGLKMEENMINSKLKVIVFDLDGTLYEDTHHFDYYAEKLRSKLPSELRNSFWEDYQLSVQGNHTLKIGTVYDIERDLVLIQEHNIVKAGYRWDGHPLSDAEIMNLYPKPITLDLVHMISIGDLWWVPSAIARHYGLGGEASQEAFLEIRRYMMDPEFVMTRVPGFREALWNLKESGYKSVLLTNSPKKDSEVILSKLGLENVFDKKVFEGQKPTRTVERFNEIKDHFQAEFHEVLSIGDNWINEILPAKELGCSTILIDPHGISKKGYADKVVKNISELIPVLRELKAAPSNSYR
ncbi:HAD family hydrolase [Bacillus sp. V3-13]|uniref:HAD family hydrolase n=1 Tax=Bacillus sp. V3-13 TaxID=2053728 RepID=UPI0015E0CCC8|nr:HAD family hydrolase [Bacillus sp. V3-13]